MLVNDSNGEFQTVVIFSIAEVRKEGRGKGREGWGTNFLYQDLGNKIY